MDGALEVSVGDGDGFGEGLALGELRGDGGREGAAAAMGVHVRGPARGEGLGLAGRPGEAVGQVVAFRMAALEQERHAIGLGELERLGDAAERFPSEQDRGFVEVRRDHGGERDEPRLHGGDGVGSEQGGAAGGDHDGIDDRGDAGGFDEVRDGEDDLGVEQHAGLEGLGSEVRRDLRALFRHERGRRSLHAGDAARILRGEARDRGRAEDAVRGERQQVRLHAGAGAAVRSGDAEGDGQFAGRGGVGHASSAGRLIILRV